MARDISILVTGAGGQVGTALRPLLPEARFATRSELDVTDESAVAAAVAGCSVIIHLAADTHVDRCELHPRDAERVNAGGTGIVAAAARTHGAKVIYVSTDYVFAGDRAGEYREEDPVDPLNVYGRTKLDGEHHLDPELDLIVRSSWIFGAGRNFIRTVLEASTRGPVRVVDDQRGRPTSATALATALAFLLDRELHGTIHVAGDGEPCTWADLAESALGIAGRAEQVVRIDTPTYIAQADKVLAPRPPNSALALTKARSLGVPLLDWQRSVHDYMEAGA